MSRKNVLEYVTKNWCSDSTIVTGIIGLGGQGKSYLVRKWVDDISSNLDIKPDGIFWWSFSSPNDADLFIEKAYRYFAGNYHQHDQDIITEKITFLVGILEKGKYLIVLDNLETQLRENDGLSDSIAQLITAFLNSKAIFHFLITCRYSISELMPFYRYKEYKLQGFNKEETRQLLRANKVSLSNKDLKALVDATDGNALALL